MTMPPPEPGAPGPPRRRRLRAVFAADVANYGGLVSIDETNTLDGLTMLRRIGLDTLAGHGGWLFGLPGDGIFALFESAIDAVRCALDMQARLAQVPQLDYLKLRIGIHLGEVVFENEMPFGEALVVAARLESLAEPGSILVSSPVRDAVVLRINAQFLDRGVRPLKHSPRSIGTFEVVPPVAGAAAVPLDDLTEVVGRYPLAEVAPVDPAPEPTPALARTVPPPPPPQVELPPPRQVELPPDPPAEPPTVPAVEPDPWQFAESFPLPEPEPEPVPAVEPKPVVEPEPPAAPVEPPPPPPLPAPTPPPPPPLPPIPQVRREPVERPQMPSLPRVQPFIIPGRALDETNGLSRSSGSLKVRAPAAVAPRQPTVPVGPSPAIQACLPDLIAALTVHIGPLARVLGPRMAVQSRNPTDLVAKLAAEVRNEAERKVFLAKASGILRRFGV